MKKEDGIIFLNFLGEATIIIIIIIISSLHPKKPWGREAKIGNKATQPQPIMDQLMAKFNAPSIDLTLKLTIRKQGYTGAA